MTEPDEMIREVRAMVAHLTSDRVDCPVGDVDGRIALRLLHETLVCVVGAVDPAWLESNAERLFACTDQLETIFETLLDPTFDPIEVCRAGESDEIEMDRLAENASLGLTHVEHIRSVAGAMESPLADRQVA